MTTDTTFLIFTIALCLLAIAGIIVGIALEEHDRRKHTTDPHEETDQCRN